MKKNILITLALLLALTISPALAAVNTAVVTYDGDCNAAYITVSSGTATVDIDDCKNFNCTYSGETSSAVTITIDSNSFDIIRTATPVIDIIYNGSATAATVTIATDTLTITRDANSTNTTWDLTNAAYNTIGELVTAMDAREDINCTVYDTTYNAFTSADLVDMEATSFKTALDLTFSGTQTWDITNANYNTVGELLTALEAVGDITIVDWDSDHDTLCTALNDVTTQDITTLYTVLSTEQITYAVATYNTFGLLEAQMETRDDLTLTPYGNYLVEQKFSVLSSGTLDDQTKTSIEATDVTLTAGGTVDDTFSPFYKISGSLDDVLFCLQLYQPTNWSIAYESSGTIYVIGGP